VNPVRFRTAVVRPWSVPAVLRSLSLALSLALLLAACGTPAPDESFIQDRGSVVARPAAPPVQAPAAVAVAPEPPRPDPTVLRGMSGDDVARLIGRPSFRRTDDPASLWRYGTSQCVLDLYLRADGPVYRVVHYEFRGNPKGKTGPGIDATACFGQLTRAASGANGG
jgi:hypothetical protein